MAGRAVLKTCFKKKRFYCGTCSSKTQFSMRLSLYSKLCYFGTLFLNIYGKARFLDLKNVLYEKFSQKRFKKKQYKFI